MEPARSNTVQRAGTAPSQFVREIGARLDARGWWHSFVLPDGRRIEGANTIESLRERMALFPIEQDLSGKRALDIGAWDGWFSFELERRGAEVTAIDSVRSANFLYLHRELGSHIDYRVMDVYELAPGNIGQFDIVLFLGVLYHLKHPLLALERVCSVTRGFAVVQTFVSPDPGPPLIEFYEQDELGGQFDNWCGPNASAVAAMCRTAGFARAEFLAAKEHFAAFACYRRFDDAPPAGASRPASGSCVHMLNLGVNFDSRRDEYATFWFTSDCQDLDCDSVQIRVGEFDARPVFVALKDGVWQANFKLPPGLDRGWHEARVRVAGSDWSEPQKIAVDLPLVVSTLVIAGVRDGRKWTPYEVGIAPGAVLTVWIEGLPENCRRHDLIVRIDGVELVPEYLSDWNAGHASQANVSLKGTVDRGEHAVSVSVADAVSDAVRVKFR